MIASFGNQATADVFNGKDTKVARSIAQDIRRVARRKLDLIEAAAQVQDLNTPPGNKLEKLKKNLVGWWSIRINDQFRIIFRFEAGQALDITDYH